MSRTFHDGDRRIRVRAIHNNPPDLRRLARALIELAQAQAEVEAEAHSEAAARAKRQKKAAPLRPHSLSTNSSNQSNEMPEEKSA